MESLEIKKYNDFDVSFLLGSRNVKVNATEMAKIFGKLTENFMELKSTKAFIKACNLPLFRGRLGIKDGHKIYENRGSAGLWFHRVLALKFAAWLDEVFEVWVYITIEEILFGNIAEEKTKKDERASRRSELMEVLIKTPEYLELIQINYDDKVSTNKIKAQFNRQLQIF